MTTIKETPTKWVDEEGKQVFFRVQMKKSGKFPTDEEMKGHRSFNGGHDNTGKRALGLCCCDSPEELRRYVNQIGFSLQDLDKMQGKSTQICVLTGEILQDVGEGVAIRLNKILARISLREFSSWFDQDGDLDYNEIDL